jgi:AcrR family transcriptional regulator
MIKMNIKDNIIKSSVKIFSIKGFHGTSMREIAREVNCSLPTLYYYFENKNDLFEEVAVKEFLRLIERMNTQLDFNAEPEKVYSGLVLLVKELSEYDKEVFKMALKIGFGFEGTQEAKEKIIQWEKKRTKTSIEFLEKYKFDETIKADFATLLVNLVEHMIEKVILFNEDISEDSIKRQINLLFRLVR